MEPDFVIKKKVRFGSKDDYVADEADQVGKVDDLCGVMEVDIDSSCMQDVDRIESSLKEGVVYEQEENPVNEKGFNKEFGEEIEMDESEKSGSDDKNLVMILRIVRMSHGIRKRVMAWCEVEIIRIR